MKLMCEIIVKDVLPALRALLAKNLIEEHDMTQKQAAENLGMTQPAMSQYKNKLRGYKGQMLEQSEEVSVWVNKICRKTMESEEPIKLEKEFCEICTEIRESGLLEEKYDVRDPKIH
ncbi:MAG: transcriptional regulator [Candidatus Aenigmatarchaeota archaeon]